MQIKTGRVELVSVVMPSLNQVEFIERAIRSVLNQQHSSVELIVMDGGSTDGTQDLLRGLAHGEESRLRWLSEPDRGPAHAVNKAMSMAHGEVIGWLNADDVYTPGAIERAVHVLEANPRWMMAYGHGQHIDEFDRVIDSYPTRRPDAPIRTFAEGCFICQPTVFMRKSAVDELGQLDENLKAAFDLEWWLRLFSRHPGRIGFVDAIQAQSRLHRDCITIDQRETVIRESMQIVARYLGACPLHWFKSYAIEMLIKYPHTAEFDVLEKHLHGFADAISSCLSEIDLSDIKGWLETELSKAQKAQKSPSLKRDIHSKLRATILKFVHLNKLSKGAYEQAQEQIELIRSSGLFDEAWYLSNYRDVSRVGVDPIEHYLKYGGKEGRNPSLLFNTISYVESNPEAAKLGMNPLVHFLLYGKADADRAKH